MSIMRFSSRTHRLGESFLMQFQADAKSFKRIAGYSANSLFVVSGQAHELIPELKIAHNVDINQGDLKAALLGRSKALGRWSKYDLPAQTSLARQRYRRLDSCLQKIGQGVRVALVDIYGFVHGKVGVKTEEGDSKLGLFGSMNETRIGWQRHCSIVWEGTWPLGQAWLEGKFNIFLNGATPLPQALQSPAAVVPH